METFLTRARYVLIKRFDMKKTLVALAVLAASGASFAQVTITGQIRMGFEADHTNAATAGPTGAALLGAMAGAAPYGYSNASTAQDTAGLGVETANLYFNVAEDLGGGQKVAAMLGFDTVKRGGASSVVGGDTTLTYTNNSFGQIELGSKKDSDVFSDIAYANDNLITFDSKLNQIETSSDYISYAAPVGPVIFVFKHGEPSSGLGLGSGTQGISTSTTQGTNTVALVYLQGALKAVGAYRQYTNQDETGGIFDGNGLTKKSVVHLEAGYDFNVAKVGFGYDHVDASWGVTQNNIIMGLNVPVNAWNFAVAYETSQVQGAHDVSLAAFANSPAAAFVGGLAANAFKSYVQNADGTAHGVTALAQYNFSKSTNFVVRYAAWERSGYEQLEAFGQTNNINEFGYKGINTQTQILLNKSF